MFYAGEDGCWGSYTELYRKENGERLTDAVIVFLCMPDEEVSGNGSCDGGTV